MAAVGEESGELNDMLFRIASTFESDVNRTVKTVVSLIEPVLILCIGAIVVLLVFAILLPIFQLDFFAK
jgi:general secretion pathway protein F